MLGNSCSAMPVFLLAAGAGSSVSAVLACSPTKYRLGVLVRATVARVACPVFVTQDSDWSQEAATAAIPAAVPGRLKQQFRPVSGAYGTSILRSDRYPCGVVAGGAAVDSILDEGVPA